MLRKLSSNFLSRKTLAIKIIDIPKPWKMPVDNYLEPIKWILKFSQPSQVRPRAFLDCSVDVKLGPSDDVDKEKAYKNPEYYSYHPLSFINMEEDLNCKRCRPQPSPFANVPTVEGQKCPWIKKIH